MKINKTTPISHLTHEGAPAKRINAEQELRRSLMCCLLWEGTFYEDGISIAERIASLVPKVDPPKVAELAIMAREQMKLRHAPLWLVREMARKTPHRALVANTLARIIQRPDELTEFLALYWLDGRQPLAAQVKQGLAQAFTKFDAYQLSKYDRQGTVRLRDVLFLCHAKPKDAEQEKTWKQLIAGTLPSADTWEVALSSGQDKKATWERLLSGGRLGGLALLRNLRNMITAGVPESAIKASLQKMKTERILPFRFIAAARYVPALEAELEQAMFKSIQGHEKLPGKTIILADISGSMDNSISAKSDIKRYDAANGLAILARELCLEVAIYSFSNEVVRIPDRRGFALRDAIADSQDHTGTYLGQAVRAINDKEQYDRIIVLTDEQAHDPVPNPKGKGYVINVACYENGVGYGAWTHIDGWSEACLDYIQATEEVDKQLSLRNI